MKKSILKNLLALTFALGALVFVAGNVYADHTVVAEIGDQGGGTTSEVKCYNQLVYQLYDSDTSCTNCKTVYHVKPNYNTESKCTPKK